MDSCFACLPRLAELAELWKRRWRSRSLNDAPTTVTTATTATTPVVLPAATVDSIKRMASIFGFSAELIHLYPKVPGGTWELQDPESALVSLRTRHEAGRLQKKSRQLYTILLSCYSTDGHLLLENSEFCHQLEADRIVGSKIRHLQRLVRMAGEPVAAFDPNGLEFAPQLSWWTCCQLRSHVTPCDMSFEIDGEAAWEVLPTSALAEPDESSLPLDSALSEFVAELRADDEADRLHAPMSFEIEGEAAWNLLPLGVIAADIASSHQGLPANWRRLFQMVGRSWKARSYTRKDRREQVLLYHSMLRRQRHNFCEAGCSHQCEEACARWAKLYDYNGRRGITRHSNFFTEILPETISDQELARERRLRRQLWQQQRRRLQMDIGAQLTAFPCDGRWPELPQAGCCERRRLTKLKLLQQRGQLLAVQLQQRRHNKHNINNNNNALLTSSGCVSGSAKSLKPQGASLRVGVRFVRQVATLPAVLRQLVWRFWAPYKLPLWQPACVMCQPGMFSSPAPAFPIAFQFHCSLLRLFAARRSLARAKVRSFEHPRCSFSALPVEVPLGAPSMTWKPPTTTPTATTPSFLGALYLQRRLWTAWALQARRQRLLDKLYRHWVSSPESGEPWRRSRGSRWSSGSHSSRSSGSRSTSPRKPAGLLGF
ncbi:unnamed protein product [Polarella glacialis]|uniref:Uncharacterized protein n=1 Tax=Polarella glacialis TaxID=89957 RepID=A0A813DD80_POLGL|nr:unnamed protein product [Polarella glacialis]